MIDHITISVSDFEASKAFYDCVLAPLGHELAWEDAGLRIAEWGDFSIAAREPLSPIYREGYYGAYVLDPDGNNVEAVHHRR